MNHLITSLVCFFVSTAAVAQQGYEISLKLKPYKNSQVYLGYHYGKVKALADSAVLDASSSGVFKGKDKLPGGIYFIVSPSRQILFEILIDNDQHFSVAADSASLPGGIEFTGSDENARFRDYSAFAGRTGKQISDLNDSLRNVKTAKDSASIIYKVRVMSHAMELYRDSMTRRYPESFLAALFYAMDEPKIPPASEHPGGKYDSNFVYEYYKSHYWDKISFSDDRLVRTPFFEPKLERYFRDLVSPNPDSLIREIDWMLLYSRSAKEMYRYLMVHFVQQYVNPRFMGQDAVFVHLFEKYINTGKAEFFTPQYKEFATRRAYSLMANLIGRPAANMKMVDTAGRPLPLYNLKSKFTVICFWDPTCSHCKEVVPKVDSMYKAKWNRQGVALYGVKTEGPHDEWLEFIADKKLDGWHHVHQLPADEQKDVAEGRPGYKQLYDVYQTPLLYLLDDEKRIIAKKLTYLQLDEVITARLQSTKK